MGESLKLHATSLAVLDRLFVNQVLVNSAYTEAEFECIGALVQALREKVSESGASGIGAEILKHEILCLLEVDLGGRLVDLNLPNKPALPPNLTQDVYDRVNCFEQSFFKGILIATSELSGRSSQSVALRMAGELLETFRKAPPAIRYRLVERCTAYEHRLLPLQYFSWLVGMHILPTGKHVSEAFKLASYREAIVRALLLCEFGMTRTNTESISGKQRTVDHLLALIKEASPAASDALRSMAHRDLEFMASNRPQFVMFRHDVLNERARAISFLSAYGRDCYWPRVVRATQAKWPSMIGANMVTFAKKFEHPDSPLYCDSDPACSISGVVSERLRNEGITALPRTIHESRRELRREVYPRVCGYLDAVRVIGVPPALTQDSMFTTFFACTTT